MQFIQYPGVKPGSPPTRPLQRLWKWSLRIFDPHQSPGLSLRALGFPADHRATAAACL
jgi:hypothetical protein